MSIHGYVGNIITANPTAPTSSVASGVWTTEQQLIAVAAGNWPFTIPTQQISRSLRFNSADSAYLSRTPAVAGNRKTWTWSGWVKRTAVTNTGQNLFATSNGAGTNTGQLFFNDGILELNSYASSAYQWRLITTQVWRDLSAWYHIVVAVDTTQATSSNRIKMYVNGVQITAFTTSTYPSQNIDGTYNLNEPHYIGSQSTTAGYFPGYLAEVNFIDGQALTPSSFGQINVSTGVWEPIPYTGTYGTNGFELPFTNNTSTTTLSYDLQSADVTRILTSGSGTFTVPSYTTLTVELWGGGGGGGASSSGTTGGSGGTGGSTTFSAPTGTLTANGGAGGTGAHDEVANGSGGAGGTASGGDSNVTGNAGGSISGPGGNAPSGGDGNVRVGSSWTGQSGNLPGGGATGGYTNLAGAGSGGSGGYSKKTYTAGQLTPGSTISYSVGAGGTAGSGTTRNGGVGAIGGIRVTVNGSNNDWWNSYNFSVTAGAGNDSLVDSPTAYGTDTGVGGEVRGNYATANPLDAGSGFTFTNGNLDYTNTTDNRHFRCTFAMPSSGKFYWEVTITASPSNHGIALIRMNSSLTQGSFASNDFRGYANAGTKYSGAGSVAYGNSFTTNDVIGVAVDMDSGKIWFSKNGTFQASGDPAAGTNAAFTDIVSSGFIWMPGINTFAATPNSGVLNFGQRAFAYTAPSGFKALCTTNLPTPTIGATSTTQANAYMNAVLWTGNGSTQSITSVGFQPDLVWTKDRGAAFDHTWFDAVRGATKFLRSNSTSAEETQSDSLTSFNSNGFSVGADAVRNNINKSGASYVSWNWNAGGSTVTNTSGTISAQVRANTTSGFSIVTYTGNGSANQTVGHGLGVAPVFGILKDRDTNSNNNQWHVFATAYGDYYGYLSATNAFAATAEFYPTSGSSTTVTIGRSSPVANSNESGDNYVMYLFTPVAGYSAFGSYVGNGSTDGPFVYTGFRPEFVMIKSATTAGTSWEMFDNARETSNLMDLELLANSANAEGTYTFGDFVSNGFKLRSTNNGVNQSSATLIYMAFAESPFKYALAR
jgi:hypothetical protein